MTRLKIKLYKRQMVAALVWYVNKLTEKFQYRLQTPSTVIEMQRYLDDLQTSASRSSVDSNPAWQVKVKVVSTEGTGHFTVAPEDDSTFLYLDFDQ